ncbi:hypothetical protein Lesp02_20200 [Lentzea sp. NBRC 105346]|uniref:hypothetical protein n=1 Tax=Lentzea sp. NBRC 105346 TaxID=3032205 RepID=UPI0024A5C436|nr:hypothetical protein [Lentzea sp. NBRC 105346]GLZ29830.1 hypothetical protein Lesp02_20200 [Lentzea sp. NBRC 105346]
MLVNVENTSLAALLDLVSTGFRMFVVGDPAGPDAVVYVRTRRELRDMIVVHGPDECEAVRMIHRAMTRQVEGTTPEVVATVLGWPC